MTIIGGSDLALNKDLSDYVVATSYFFFETY